MTYTQPPAKTAGDPTLASDWNVYVKDNLIHLRALVPDAGASNLPLVSSSTTTATFAQLGTAGIENNAITTDKIAVAARGLVGEIVMWAGSESGTIPTGWLLCNGQAVSRTGAYQPLYDVIGTAYGTGNGSTTFNVPDLRGRVPLGVSGSYARGTSGGSATTDVSHTHTTDGHRHGLGSHKHTHSSKANGVEVVVSNSAGTSNPEREFFQTGGSTYGSEPPHTHQVTWSGLETDAATGDTALNNETVKSGGSSTQSVLNPYQTVNYLIFAGV